MLAHPVCHSIRVMIRKTNCTSRSESDSTCTSVQIASRPKTADCVVSVWLAGRATRSPPGSVGADACIAASRSRRNSSRLEPHAHLDSAYTALLAAKHPQA